jgi:hypothetical protein
MIMSQPAYLSIGPKIPPELEAAIVGRGPFVTTSKWPDAGRSSRRGPVAKMSLLSARSRSIFGSIVEDTASQTAGADVLFGQLGVQRFLRDGPGGQVDA